MKIVVVGNGMVGFHFCEEFRNRNQEHELVVFGEEALPAYERVHLTEAFCGKSQDELLMAPRAWYEENQITLYTGERVVAIDEKHSYITTSNGRTESYDRLVLATGSSAFIPVIPGVELEHVFAYRTMEDVDRIKAAASLCTTGAVIGGGLLGLEAAKALLDLGVKQTTVVEHGPRLMQRQLDHDASTMLAQSIHKLGVSICTSARMQEFVAEDGKVKAIRMEDGTQIPAEIIVISAGIRPRDDLARSSGLSVGERGGIVVDSWMRTSGPNIYAIGECALHKNQIHGLVAPGFRMAETCALHILGERLPFKGYESSTLLKLLGIDVSSLGDPLTQGDDLEELILTNKSRGLYKKLVVEKSSRRLRGAILVGDKTDFGMLSGLLASGTAVPEEAESVFANMQGTNASCSKTIVNDDAVPVCNCKGVTRGTIRKAVAEGHESIAALKKHTKAGTGCGSCVSEVEKILKLELQRKGVDVNNHLCEHFPHSRAELFQIIKASRIDNFDALIIKHGKGMGCEICKPTVANLFATIQNEHILGSGRYTLQDSNDRFLANIQKNGTYSVVPRIPAGEITPEKLMVIAKVAMDFDLYTKITGGQRIDLFGARLEDLPKIWKRLIDAGFESGHAYAKSVRTVKSCVGSTWCRFGVQDSVGMALRLEERYKGLRSPHKIKMGVSGCARECAEAQGKDIGVIAAEGGYSLYVCGNGGATPRHADLLAVDLSGEELIRIIDRVLMYYIRTADRLQRTSKWLDEMPGGLDAVKAVVLADSLGICSDLEAEMETLVQGFQCEWKTVLETPEMQNRFRAFINTDAPDASIQFRRERAQITPHLIEMA